MKSLRERTVSGLGLAMLFALLTLSAAEAQRPRVGLVLGGGGARGVAHVGVLRVLEEMRVPIDCISGTSIGSLVGGVYASGAPLDEITEQLKAIDWDTIFSDDPPRTEKPFHAKRDDYTNLFKFELGQRGAKILLPPGTTAGYKVEFLLREMTARAGDYANQDFDKLPIPFRALATDLEHGTVKEFRHGDLVKAMRASMSVPGVIAPVDIDGVLYVDGGLLQNVPVASARDACADSVIAVNVGSGLLPREKLNSALNISVQMVNLLTEQNVRVSLKSLKPTDILIEPALGDFSAANFSGSIALIDKGEAAARAVADKLSKLAVPEQDYLAWRAAVEGREADPPAVTDVVVASTNGRVDSKVIQQELASVPGVDPRRRPETDFSLSNLNTRLEQVYGRGDFERLDYRMIDRHGTRTVEVEGLEKSWGPNYLKFGLGFATDSDETRFNASVSHRMTWVNSLGGEWRNDAQFGYTKRLVSEFFQPASLRNNLFIAPRVEIQDEPLVYYVNGRRIGEFDVTYGRIHVHIGAQNKFGEVRVGAFVGKLTAEEDFGVITSVPTDRVDELGYTASITFDQIDNPLFARDGFLFRATTFGTTDLLDSPFTYNKTDVLAIAAKSWGKHAVQIAGYVGLNLDGTIPAYDPFVMGGFLRGSGFRLDELLGENVAMARAVYTYQLGSLTSPIGRGIYVGGSVEAVRATTGVDFTGDEDVHPAASVFVGADTFLGSLYLGFGQAFGSEDPAAVYFLLGTP